MRCGRTRTRTQHAMVHGCVAESFGRKMRTECIRASARCTTAVCHAHTHARTRAHTSSSSHGCIECMCVCVCGVHIGACAYPIIINVPGTVHNSPRVQQHSLCATTALQMRWQQQQPPPAVVASNANEYTFHTLHSNFDTVNLLRSLDRNVARDMSDFIYAIAKSIANCVKLLFSKTHNIKP